NLFFNGEVQAAAPLDFQRDFHDRGKKQKKRKRIRIDVDFELPPGFKLRKELHQLKALGTTFTVSRYWELDNRRNPVGGFEVTVQGAPVPNAVDVARQILGLIAYRYIPNRSIPSELLRGESQAIADSIFLRMKGDKHAAALLDSLIAAASRMLEDAARSLST